MPASRQASTRRGRVIGKERLPKLAMHICGACSSRRLGRVVIVPAKVTRSEFGSATFLLTSTRSLGRHNTACTAATRPYKRRESHTPRSPRRLVASSSASYMGWGESRDKTLGRSCRHVLLYAFFRHT